MPNDAGPHDRGNAKKRIIPAYVSSRDIIGYTTAPRQPGRPVTVYTTLGHFTQVHASSWNVGWDSYVGWQCLFFGNVKDGPHAAESSHDQNGRLLAPLAYVAKLNLIGRNRFNGLVWDLTTPSEGLGYHLREFWIRGTGTASENQFAHPSRGYFVPVTADPERSALWRQVSQWRGAFGAG